MAEKKSITKKLGRVRPPRVHITYDVEIGDAIVKREIPFIVGVLADLSGQRAEPLPKMTDPKRKFTQIDRDNFNDVLAKQAPRLLFKVPNKLPVGKELLPVELNFKKLNDFEPQNVARQVPQLNALLELRTKLQNLRSNLFGNDTLEELLKEAMAQTEARRKPAEAGGDSGAVTPGAEPVEKKG